MPFSNINTHIFQPYLSKFHNLSLKHSPHTLYRVFALLSPPLCSHFAVISTALRHSTRISVMFRPQHGVGFARWNMYLLRVAEIAFLLRRAPSSLPPMEWNTRKRIGISNCNLHIYLYICYGIYRYVYRYCIYNLSWLYLKVSSSLAVAYRLVRTPAHVIHTYIHAYVWLLLMARLTHILYIVYIRGRYDVAELRFCCCCI